MLSLQKEQITDDQVRAAFEETQLRVYTMAMVHEHLYQSAEVSALDLATYLDSIFGYVLRVAPAGLELNRHTEMESCTVTSDLAIHLGLIVTELLTNAVKHAFPGRSTGLIELHLKRVDESFRITVIDDGVGVPNPDALRSSDSMGMQIVNALISQLKGSLNVTNHNGTQCEVWIPQRAADGPRRNHSSIH